MWILSLCILLNVLALEFAFQGSVYLGFDPRLPWMNCNVIEYTSVPVFHLEVQRACSDPTRYTFRYFHSCPRKQFAGPLSSRGRTLFVVGTPGSTFFTLRELILLSKLPTPNFRSTSREGGTVFREKGFVSFLWFPQFLYLTVAVASSNKLLPTISMFLLLSQKFFLFHAVKFDICALKRRREWPTNKQFAVLACTLIKLSWDSTVHIILIF
jgi:hypothetical protein